MRLIFVCSLGLLLGLDLPAARAAADVHWSPQADMDDQLFPSLIIATATRRPGDDDEPRPDLLGDHYGLLGISIRSPAANTKIKVTVRENSILNATSWEGSLPKGNHIYFVAPKIAYKYEELRRVRQQMPLSVIFDLEVGGQPIGNKAETVTLHSINDCPFAVDDDEETLSDDDKDKGPQPGRKPNGLHGDSSTALGWMFAAYVNEDHPVLDVLLNEALHTGIIDNVDGYQDGKPEEALRQAYAVWKVLQDRGVRYSDISTTPGGSDKVTSQDVRFVDESLRHKQANCVDGSVLFASILRKMGLAPFLVVVPGHMYMGIALSGSDDDESVACIETTLIGAGDVDAPLKETPATAALEKTLGSAARANPAWKSFRTAVSYATAAFARDKAKFDDEDNADYQVIDIAEARADGIMPIPFDRPESRPELPGGPATAPTPAAPKALPTPFVKPPSSPSPKATPGPVPAGSADKMTGRTSGGKLTGSGAEEASSAGGGSRAMPAAAVPKAPPRAPARPAPKASPGASASGNSSLQ